MKKLLAALLLISGPLMAGTHLQNGDPITVSSVTAVNLQGGGTQCVQTNNDGQVTGTGSACGSGSGGADNLGSHVATMTISAPFGITVSTIEVSTQTVSGQIVLNDGTIIRSTTTFGGLTSITVAAPSTGEEVVQSGVSSIVQQNGIVAGVGIVVTPATGELGFDYDQAVIGLKFTSASADPGATACITGDYWVREDTDETWDCTDNTPTWTKRAKGTHVHSTSDITSGTLAAARGGTDNTAATDDRTLVGNGSTFDLKALPSCSDGTTSKLLYDTATNSFSCGTDQAGSAATTSLITTQFQLSDVTLTGVGTDDVLYSTTTLTLSSGACLSGTAHFQHITGASSNSVTYKLKSGSTAIYTRGGTNVAGPFVWNFTICNDTGTVSAQHYNLREQVPSSATTSSTSSANFGGTTTFSLTANGTASDTVRPIFFMLWRP